MMLRRWGASFPSRVCTECRFSGSHDAVFLGVPASGQRVVNIGAGVQEFDENGKIVSEHAYWDATVFLRAAGAPPASFPSRAKQGSG